MIDAVRVACLAALLLVVPAASGKSPVAEMLPVPRGFKGLRFGMTVKEVKKTLPGLLHWEILSPVSIGPDREEGDDLDFAEKRALNKKLPGTQAQAETTIGNMRASCDFWFLVRERLSRMKCSIELPRDKGRHLLARKTVLDTLKGKYGPPTRSKDRGKSDSFSWTDEWTWNWEDDNASLELHSLLKAYGHSVVESECEVDNTAAEHADLIEKTRAAVNVDYRRAVAARRAKLHAEEMFLKRYQRRLDQDL